MAESHKETVDREFKELLEELRVLVPGVQLLAGFLLTVAFSERFQKLGEGQKGLYFIDVIATLVCATLLLAPSAQHRIRWRQPEKDRLLATASHLALAGTVVLAVSMVVTGFLIGNLTYGGNAGGYVGGGLAAGIVWLWYGWPVARRAMINGHREQPRATGRVRLQPRGEKQG